MKDNVIHYLVFISFVHTLLLFVTGPVIQGCYHGYVYILYKPLARYY